MPDAVRGGGLGKVSELFARNRWLARSQHQVRKNPRHSFAGEETVNDFNCTLALDGNWTRLLGCRAPRDRQTRYT
jgi:hypothetical protein